MTLIDDRTMTTTLLSGSIGAQIEGLDLREASDAQIEDLKALLYERKVLFFKNQHLTPESHVAVATRFGTPTEGHPVIPGVKGFPNVFEIDYSKERELYAQYGDVAQRKQGLDWHTDVTFVERPPMGSILNAVVIPPHGGDTMWSNQEAAYEALSPSLRGFLDTLHAVHDGRAAFQYALDLVGEGHWEGQALTELEPALHPVVRTIPETGRKVLFVNPGFTSHIAELSRAESDALLAYLYRHSVQSEFVVRYHWSQGDVAFWDNRQTQHSVVGDFGSQHRVIQRVTLRGDTPV
jgi:taurine dioxygenase